MGEIAIQESKVYNLEPIVIKLEDAQDMSYLSDLLLMSGQINNLDHDMNLLFNSIAYELYEAMSEKAFKQSLKIKLKPFEAVVFKNVLRKIEGFDSIYNENLTRMIINQIDQFYI